MYKSKHLVLHIQDFKDLLEEEAKLVNIFLSESFLKKNVKYRKLQTIRRYGKNHEATLKPEILANLLVS